MSIELGPRLREMPSRKARAVADGFSCKTQIEQATGRRPLHLAQLLQMARHGAEAVDHRTMGWKMERRSAAFQVEPKRRAAPGRFRRRARGLVSRRGGSFDEKQENWTAEPC